MFQALAILKAVGVCVLTEKLQNVHILLTTSKICTHILLSRTRWADEGFDKRICRGNSEGFVHPPRSAAVGGADPQPVTTGWGFCAIDANNSRFLASLVMTISEAFIPIAARNRL